MGKFSLITRAASIELIGCLILGFCFILIVSYGFDNEDIAKNTLNYITPTQYSYAYVYGLIVFLTAESSGSHLNPAITICLYLLGKLRNDGNRVLNKMTMIAYILGQLIGYFIGSFLARLMVGVTKDMNFLPESLSAYNTQWNRIVISELLGTLVITLVLAYCTFRSANRFEASLVIAVCSYLIILYLGPLSGAIFNPGLLLGRYYSGLLVTIRLSEPEKYFAAMDLEHPDKMAFKVIHLYYFLPQLLSIPIAILLNKLICPDEYSRKQFKLDDFSSLDEEVANENNRLL